MSLTVILLLLVAGALVLPSFFDDDDEGSGKNEIDGTFNDDIPLNGTEGNDLIRGFLGNDKINGLGGNDEILGGEGNDTINGGGGLDFIRGGPGNDIIDAGEGDDRVIAGAGNDTVDGGFGSDIIRAGIGNDTIYGGFDSRLQDDGSVVANVSATDRINGEAGDDKIFIWGGNSTANGASGNDELILMTGTGTFLDEGGANDFYAFANITDAQETFVIIDDFNPAEDTLTLTADFDEDFENVAGSTVSAFAESDTVNGTNGVTIRLRIETDDPVGEPPEGVEFASAFIVGANIATFDIDAVNVVVTQGADLFDAEGSLAFVQSGGITAT